MAIHNATTTTTSAGPTLLSCTVLWLTFPLVSLSTKCLLTSQPCTRWGSMKEGADYEYPITTAALQLLTVGSTLFVLQQVVVCCKGPEPIQYSHVHHQEQQPQQSVPTSSTVARRRAALTYSSVGLAVGIKYLVGHWALLITPVGIFELFHCLNILSIAAFAHWVLGERLSRGQVVCCAGIVLASLLMVHQDHHQAKNMYVTLTAGVLVLNLVNCSLAGAVVVLLRCALLQPQQPTNGRTGIMAVLLKVTAYKLFLGGLVASLAAWIVEDAPPMNHQQVWILATSCSVILIYHLNLSCLCWLASAPAVGMVEALRPVPALLLVALVRGSSLPTKPVGFWVGSVLLLILAIGFKLLGVRQSQINPLAASDENDESLNEASLNAEEEEEIVELASVPATQYNESSL